MPQELRRGPSGPEAQAATLPISSDNVTNQSDAEGDTLTEALDNLAASGTELQTDTLTNGNQTLTISQRYVLPAGTIAATVTKTITPPAAGQGIIIEIGTQTAGRDVVIVDGSNAATLATIVGGTKKVVWLVSDGTNISSTVVMPLGAEPIA